MADEHTSAKGEGDESSLVNFTAVGGGKAVLDSNAVTHVLGKTAAADGSLFTEIGTVGGLALHVLDDVETVLKALGWL